MTGPKQTNSLLWGAVLAVAVALMIAFLPNSALAENPQAIGGSFFWGWACGELYNWYWRKRFNR